MSEVQIHETAIIDDNVSIGDFTRIWHWVHVCSGATIGEKCSLGQNVFVGGNVKIGSNVKIQNNVSVYEGVELEDNVFCGPSMVFTNVYNPRSQVVRKTEYRKTLVREGVTLGANSTVICGVEIGHNAFIAAGAVVNRDVKPFALIAGLPGKQIGWMSRFGERIDLPLEGDGEFQCPHTKEIYVLSNGELRLQ